MLKKCFLLGMGSSEDLVCDDPQANKFTELYVPTQGGKAGAG